MAQMESTASKQNVDRISQSAHEAVDRATQAASSVADRFGEKYDEFYAMQQDWVEAGREYVREHPVAAIGMALAAGYLLSMLMRGRD
jgi:ElaB/YqjD/DUF883 family membrane-anchored ribosome-binding protein